MRDLSPSERTILESRLKKTKDLSEWKRVFAILGFDDGQSIEELAKALRRPWKEALNFLGKFVVFKERKTVLCPAFLVEHQNNENFSERFKSHFC